MEWISIEDRLPPQAAYVLVAKFDHRPKMHMYSVSVAERIRNQWYEGKDGEEITSNGKYGRITHWMPIPDAPPLPEIS